MRRGLASILTVLLLGPAARAQDFQSPENLFKKAYDAEFPHDPSKRDLPRAIDYYGRALDRAREWLEREESREEGEKSRQRIQYSIEWAIKSLSSRARCYEAQDPVDESGAMGDWRSIAQEWKDRAPEKAAEIVALAETKIGWNGVDMHLNRFAEKAELWRRGLGVDYKGLQEFKEETWSILKGKNRDAIRGLVENLDHPEEQVRNLIAEKLQFVVDEEGIAMVIDKLTSRTHRVGAGESMRAIMERYNHVKDLEEQADKAEFRIRFIPGEGGIKPGAGKLTSDIMEMEVNAIRRKADEDRFNLPKDINTPQIFEALAKVIVDESLDPSSRTEALKVLTSFRTLQTEAVDVLLAALASVNDRVREAAAMACSQVNTRQSDDKHRLADRLMELVVYEPVNDIELAGERMAIEQEAHPDLQAPLSELTDAQARGDLDAQEAARKAVEDKKAELLRGVAARMANSDIAREKCAVSLGRMGVIKAMPSLIETLDDNAMAVRRAAHNALVQICEPLSRVRDATTEMPFKIPYDADSPRSPEAKQIELDKLQTARANLPADKAEHGEALDRSMQALQEAVPFTDGQEQWRQWWKETRGVEILVTKFDTFVREWGIYLPEDVYDKEGFRTKIEAKARYSADPKNEIERAEAVLKEFHDDHVEFYILDILDAVAKANDEAMATDVIAWLFKYLDGKVPPNKDMKPATQMFVGNCLSRVIVSTGNAEARETIRDILLGNKAETPEIKTGAAFVAAYYPKDLGEIDVDRTAAEQALRDGNVNVRLAAAYAAGKIGIHRTARELAGKLRDPEAPVRHAAARAIGRIAGDTGQATLIGQDQGLMDLIGERISHETDDPLTPSTIIEPLPEIREEICFSFGEIKHRNAYAHLIRARRDFDDRVRYAAAVAFGKIGVKEPQAVNILWVMYDPGEAEEKPKFTDRQGAVLAIGDSKPPEGLAKEIVPKMIEKLKGADADRWRTWEPHQRVRRAFATALGNLGYKSPNVRTALEAALMDPAEEVRSAAYNALNRLVGGGLKDVRENILFKDPNGEPKPAQVEFMAKLPMDDLKRFVSSIRVWIDTNARDKFTQPD